METVFPNQHFKWTPYVVLSGAALIAVFLFLLIPLTQMLDPVKKADLMVREVVLAPPPPDMPPPPEDTETPPDPPPPEMTQPPAPIALTALDISINPGAGDALAIGIPSPDLLVQNMAAQIEQLFTFKDLPQAPRLVNQPQFRFPPSLVRRGITKGRVVIEIDILPNGRAEFRRVVFSTHPELIEGARKIVERARFTKPIIDGRPQRVRGSFPLVLQN